MINMYHGNNEFLIVILISKCVNNAEVCEETCDEISSIDEEFKSEEYNGKIFIIDLIV